MPYLRRSPLFPPDHSHYDVNGLIWISLITYLLLRIAALERLQFSVAPINFIQLL